MWDHITYQYNIDIDRGFTSFEIVLTIALCGMCDKSYNLDATYEAKGVYTITNVVLYIINHEFQENHPVKKDQYR